MNLPLFTNLPRPFGLREGVPSLSISRKVIMRIQFISFFMLLALMQVFGSAHSQITLHKQNAPLAEVLKDIERQSGYVFFYHDRDIRHTRISVEVTDVPLEQALQESLKNLLLTYKIDERDVLIRKAAPKKDVTSPEAETQNLAPLQQTITGRVVDSLGHPLQGATVNVKGTNRAVITDKSGHFTVRGVADDAVLVITYLGYLPREAKAVADMGNIVLYVDPAELQEVEVIVNTGYQYIPKERATGSFVFVDSTILNRRVSTDILSRLEGIVPGLEYSMREFSPIHLTTTNPLQRNTGITVRGISTVSSNVSSQPLIVLDNFPYEGDLNSINPNDIESITVLKDAAAASIWGTKSGNGVIVITTKKGKKGERMTIDFNANTSIKAKPDVFYLKNYLPAADFIEIERLLFNQGFFDNNLQNTSTYPVVSPVVEILNRLRNEEINSSEAEETINALKGNDLRDYYNQHMFQNPINQQYSLGLRGGTSNATYNFSVGYDQNRAHQIRNGFNRLTINSQSTFSVTKDLDLSGGIIYTDSETALHNQYGISGGITSGQYNANLPYLLYADDQGNALPIPTQYASNYISNAQNLGFLPWEQYPLDEIQMADNTSRTRSLILRGSAKYTILPYLSAEVLYQNERQIIDNVNNRDQNSYYVRNMINRYSTRNPDGSFTYNIPNSGGILERGTYDWNANNLRGQLYFDKSIADKHVINAIVGTEFRELKTEGIHLTSYGYNKDTGVANNNLNFTNWFQLNPSGFGIIPSTNSGKTGITNRFVSFYGNANYNYNERYSLSVSARRDGANLFGVNVNDRITPLWSAGLGWDLSKEEFYNLWSVPFLKLRMTYGYNANVFNGSAYVTGLYDRSPATGLPIMFVNTAPNPELSWERVRNINLGLDFGMLNHRINGTIEWYRKDGEDLLQPVSLPPSTGFTSFTGNSAETRTRGIDINITSKNLDNVLKWNTTLLFSTLNSKLIKYDPPLSAGSISDVFVGAVGHPMFSVFSYRWAGLDPQTGDPRGYLNGEISKDYTSIINNFSPDSLVYHGAAVPTIFGAFRNDFIYRSFSLSFNIGYKLGYMFRRPSITTNYQDMITAFTHSDYNLRWQQPGDELTTDVPSLSYPSNNPRRTFYQYSEATVEKGDHIRLQDIRISYDIGSLAGKISNMQLYGYANNVGIIWRANKHGIDPDAYSRAQYPNPFSISLGLRATF